MNLREMKKPTTPKRGYYSEIVTGSTEYPVRPRPIAPRRTKLVWQIFTEQHTATVKDNFTTHESSGSLGAAERWVTFPEDPSIKEIHVEPKHLPRNIEMERRRRLYRNLRVQDALSKAGVSLLDILSPDVVRPLASDEQKHGLCPTVNFLPLEIFDNEDLDCRTVNDWMQLGFIDGTKYPLPATVFVEKPIEKTVYSLPRNLKELVNLYDWHNAAVTHYDDETKLWTVRTLDGHARIFQLPRILIRFFAEDPCLFAERVVAAIKARNQSEACISYGKSMTLDEFEAQQIQTTSALIKYLREHWLENIVRSVRMWLRDIGKGCFSIELKVPKIYDVLKLKRFNDLTVLLMQQLL
ncbi:dynein axonemal heavy chain 1 [Venturia canescens]|uniref:dynein axonemal heavy chain 1 n=1 Tax=Venturia canescens TaxID=32260 RepID=UPI001C9C4E4A|nr:dynein axonemal heavy chain 1 [Venturia canescens]